MISVARLCLAHSSCRRPTMKTVNFLISLHINIFEQVVHENVIMEQQILRLFQQPEYKLLNSIESNEEKSPWRMDDSSSTANVSLPSDDTYHEILLAKAPNQRASNISATMKSFPILVQILTLDYFGKKLLIPFLFLVSQGTYVD